MVFKIHVLFIVSIVILLLKDIYAPGSGIDENESRRKACEDKIGSTFPNELNIRVHAKIVLNNFVLDDYVNNGSIHVENDVACLNDRLIPDDLVAYNVALTNNSNEGTIPTKEIFCQNYREVIDEIICQHFISEHYGASPLLAFEFAIFSLRLTNVVEINSKLKQSLFQQYLGWQQMSQTDAAAYTHFENPSYYRFNNDYNLVPNIILDYWSSIHGNFVINVGEGGMLPPKDFCASRYPILNIPPQD